MEAEYFSAISVSAFKTSQCPNPKDHNQNKWEFCKLWEKIMWGSKHFLSRQRGWYDHIKLT
jgi:hypothetical protein